MRRHEELTEADDVEGHLASCADCRATLGALSAFESADAARPTPAADVEAAWRARRRRRPTRTLRVVARAAVVLLAATGGLALAGVEVRPRTPSLARADVDAAVEAPLARLAAKLDERDRAHGQDVADALETLDDRRRADTAALVQELTALRRELAGVRLMQRSFADAATALPDPR